MDSVSQFVLGAAVGEAVLGKKLGNKAMVLGGIGGTIPDLDIFFGPFMSEVDALAFHRGISHSITFAVLGGLLFGWLSFLLYKWLWEGKPKNGNVTIKELQLLFFLALFTHALLDVFTMYGTQLFAPFSDYRVAFSTVSVADPMYTIPFLLCLVAVAFLKREGKKRHFWNWVGIVWSCSYLLFTVVNKQFIDNVFERELAEQGISYHKKILGPTILNNILWNTTVETDSVYYTGQFSWFDKSPIEFKKIPKNHHLIPQEGNRTLDILKWFTHNYYNIIVRKDGLLQFNDLRYGTFRGEGNGENDFVFRFVLKQNEVGELEMGEAKGGPEPGDRQEMMGMLWERIKGK